MMESVIRLENFYFAYNKSELVLQDIDLEIKKGSFTVVAGPSGAGKTTLCKAMTGIVPFYMGGRYSGDVQVLGESTKGRRVSDIVHLAVAHRKAQGGSVDHESGFVLL